MTLIVQSHLIASRTMRKRYMPICDIVKKVDFLLFEGECRGNGVYGGVTPALVEEAAVLVQLLEIVDVGFGAQPIQIADFEVGPLRGGRGDVSVTG